MSGRKTTYATISTDELNNLRNQAYQATSLSRTNTNLKQRNEILERWNNTNQNAIREQENRIKTLNDNEIFLDHLHYLKIKMYLLNKLLKYLYHQL